MFISQLYKLNHLLHLPQVIQGKALLFNQLAKLLEWEEERQDDDHHDSHQDLERKADLHVVHKGVLSC